MWEKRGVGGEKESKSEREREWERECTGEVCVCVFVSVCECMNVIKSLVQLWSKFVAIILIPKTLSCVKCDNFKCWKCFLLFQNVFSFICNLLQLF